MITVYGIPNCDTVKKARIWLVAHGIDHVFHDYKKIGADRLRLERWVGSAGWDAIINRAGTTFRKLSEEDKASLDRDEAIALMMAQPSLIRRPIVEGAGNLIIGFKPDAWATALSAEIRSA
jgi:arsenate reductase (glutaredoxin)